MPRLDEASLVRRDVVDAVRTIARLESRIALRHRLNQLENDVLEEYDKAVLSGQAYELDVAGLVEKA